MIDALTFVGLLTKLSATYLALTVIAVGNALPDAMLTISQAGNGKAVLGLTGGYSGQLFGLLIGFGLAMLKKSLTSPEEIAFPLFKDAKENMLDIVVIMTTFIALLVTFIYAIFNNFVFDQKLGYIFAGIYAVFFVSATVIACKQAYF